MAEGENHVVVGVVVGVEEEGEEDGEGEHPLPQEQE